MTTLHTQKPELTLRRLSAVAVTVLLLLLGRAGAAAQDNMTFMQVNCQVGLQKAEGIEHKTVLYATFKTMKQAVNAQNVLKKAIKDDDVPGSMGDNLDKAVKKLGIAWKTTKPNGTFVESLMSGQGVLLFCENTVVKAFEIQSGKKDYVELVRIDHTIREVKVTGQYRNTQPTMKPVPGMDTGYEVSWDVPISFPAGWAGNNSRIIVQPMAIDCQNEDTIAYLKPYVLEGELYHNLQDRRMAYDFFRNDSVARGFVSSTVLRDGEPVEYSERVTLRKPDKDRTYKCVYYCVLEDYNHVMYNNGGMGTGSCLAFKPFKFLDFSVASAEMPLTSEFKEDAEANLAGFERDLRLKFHVGKDELVEDSANNAQLNSLVKELRSYGSRLWYVKVQGGASPEGSYETNKALAIKRSQKAMNIIRRQLPGDVRIGTEEPHVYTWQDVLKEVEKRGNAEMTAIVKSTVENNKETEVFGLLRSMPFYESVIEPILESQRIMRCSYKYEVEHVMAADEVVAAYYADKEEYKSGKKKLSNGDYYNLFATVRDSAELDTITTLAYKHLISQPAYERLKIAPYVANRMALLNIKRGTATPDILRPFIDYADKRINGKKYIDEYTSIVKNRAEILTNQAVIYFQEQKLDTASYIVEWLPKTERVRRLRMFIIFTRDYIRYIAGACNADEAAKVREAENYVVNSNADNRAIVWSELHGQLNKKRSDVEPLVDKMADNNPKKWYLKGILWSEEAGKGEQGDADSGFKELTEMEYFELQQNNPEKLMEYNRQLEEYNAMKMAMQADTIPRFLAYFQHSFDLEPKYKRLYFNEGNVSDEIRKKYRYRKKDIPAYRRKFELLTRKTSVPAQPAPTATQEGSGEATPSAEAAPTTGAPAATDTPTGTNAETTNE